MGSIGGRASPLDRYAPIRCWGNDAAVSARTLDEAVLLGTTIGLN
jgi:hypothetical protein